MDKMNLKRCQIFTPHSIVLYMLDYMGYKNTVFGKTVVDNSCGDGRFLVEIVRRFIVDGKKASLSNKDIKAALEECVYGYEIDDHYCKECIKNVSNIAKEYGINHVKWNIHCGDGLNINKDSGFDFVVINPPYIAYKDLNIDVRKSIKEQFISCRKGKFDYSYAFIEYGLKLLSSNGKMIVISPSNMLKTVSGELIREFIKPYLVSIINCAQETIFEKVLTNPIITYYEKNNCDQFINYADTRNGIISRILKSSLKNKWVFMPVIKKERRFGDCFFVSNSIATLANEVFIHSTDSDGNIRINGKCLESGIMRIAKSPRSEKENVSKLIIFPYRYSSNGYERLSETEIEMNYPQTYAYLKSKKAELEQRDSDKGAKWFEFGRSQALAHLNRKKLMISTIITGRVFVYQLSEDEIPYSGIFIYKKSDMPLSVAFEILTSKDFYNYLISIGVQLSGKSIRVTTKDIENYMF